MKNNRIIRALCTILVSVILLLFIVDKVWVFSGSNAWQLERDESGVKILSLKSSGSSTLKIKAEMRVKAPISSVIAAFQDQRLCKEFGCYDAKVINRVSPQLYYSTFKYDLPFSSQPREFVVRSLFFRDTEGDDVLYYHTAELDAVPRDECCFRMTHFYVLWRMTPLPNGETQLQMVRDFNPNLFIPDYVFFSMLPDFGFSAMSKLMSIIEREEYRDAKFDFL